jgi:hypothetical protein
MTIKAANAAITGRLPKALRYGSGLKTLRVYNFYLLTCNIKVKIKLSLYTIKAYRRMRAVAACFLNLGSRRR